MSAISPVDNIDLRFKGYAPGSWSQVAADRTSPGGRVIGIDIIPAQPPKGVSTFQGNFLSEEVQNKVKEFLRNPQRGRLREHRSLSTDGSEQDTSDNGLEVASTSYFELEREASSSESDVKDLYELGGRQTKAQKEMAEGRMVDLVLSDMCEPWEQTTGFWIRSLNNPYHRMMNTSGMNFRDHVGSMV
jgi:21S rRNA (uridine2791-2'-O)-methyltransferase